MGMERPVVPVLATDRRGSGEDGSKHYDYRGIDDSSRGGGKYRGPRGIKTVVRIEVIVVWSPKILPNPTVCEIEKLKVMFFDRRQSLCS